MDKKEAIQIPIINLEKVGKQTFRKIPLSELPPNEELLSPYPSSEFIEDIASRGQTTPIQVTEIDGKYVVISGRRRIKALRHVCNIIKEYPKTVNAIVISDISTAGIVNLSTVENNLRSDNPLTDLEAINYLKEKNPLISEREISQQTGIPVSRIRKRLKLTKLIPEISSAVIAGKVNVTVAENIAKLSPAKQSNLLSAYIQKGKISNEDVTVVQRAVVQENANTLPNFPDCDVLSEERVIEYIYIDGLEERTTFSNLDDAVKYRASQEDGVLCKLVVMD